MSEAYVRPKTRRARSFLIMLKNYGKIYLSVPELFEKLVGKWRGINRLHKTPIDDNSVRETVLIARIGLMAR